jgi:hypothetical protein
VRYLFSLPVVESQGLGIVIDGGEGVASRGLMVHRSWLVFETLRILFALQHCLAIRRGLEPILARRGGMRNYWKEGGA